MRKRSALLAGLMVAGAVTAGLAAADSSQSSSSASKSTTAPKAAAHAYRPGVPRSQRAEMWWAARFGVQDLHVRSVSSGASIEFRYKVLDADKAAVLTDRNATPYLIEEVSGTKLEVPVMEKIGALRQVSTPQVGREYWMLFANRGHAVKPGQRVDVSVGAFHIRGLMVE